MKKIITLLGLILFCLELSGREYFSWDFTDCEIRDILFAVSMDTGLSIVGDDTVNGKGNLRYSGKNFETGFESFLNSSRLYVNKSPDLWTVSRFKFQKVENLLSLDACDLFPEQIIEKLSKELSSVITYDVLPAQLISVHYKNLTEKELIESLGKQFGNYEITENKNSYTLRHRNDYRKIDSSDSYIKITADGFGTATVDVKDIKFNEAVEKLFSWNLENNHEKNSFCFLDEGDTKSVRAVFSGRSFNELLEKFCNQNGYGYESVDNVFYFVKKNANKDEVVYGQRTWKNFNLKYSDVQNFLPLVNKKISNIETSIYEGNGKSFFAKVNPQEENLINQLISEIDIVKKTYVVNLKNIKPSVFMEHLPPFVEKENLYLADDDSCLYFKGTEEEYNNLKNQLEICDRPEKRITYDLLILQYEESSQNSWNSNLSVGMVNMGDRNSVSAQLGSVLNFNMNIVSAFGVEFAAKLQNSLEENQTKVYVDTTLHGISGKEINFQNTNTYRYRDNNLDPETGKPVYTGVTKEIVSGIKLDILGWVSGDGTITSRITASVSRQGLDTSSSTGNPPSTSEKIVTTEVSTKSGEPVILSGLIQDSESEGTARVPAASKLPVVGKLFKSQSKIKEKNQMVIYLVPHLDKEQEKSELQNSEDLINKCREICELIKG